MTVWAEGHCRFPQRAFRRIFVPISRPVPPDALIVTAYTNGDVTFRENRRIDGYHEAADLSSYQGVRAGDFVVHGLDILRGSVGVSDSSGAMSPVCTVCVPRVELDPRFFAYAMRAQAFTGFPRVMARGIREGGADFRRWETLGDLPLPVPPERTQRRIADYLDAETARMDALADRLTEANGLLGSWLQSSVELLIWSGADEVIPLMRLTLDERQIQYGIVLPGPDVDDGVPIVKGGDLLTGTLRAEGLAKTTREIEAGYGRSRLRANDVLFAIRGAVGACAVVPPEVAGANITQDVALVAAASGVDPTWLLYALRSRSVQVQADARVVGATIRGINIRDMKRLKMPMIGLRSQQERAVELARVQAYHDGVVAARARQIELLSERRQALITAAVTGQIEIPVVAA